MQWRPSHNLEFYGEFLWQGFRNEIDDRLLEEPLYGGQSYNNLVFRPGTNLVSSGTVVNPGGNLFSFQGGTFNRTDTFQYAGGMRFNQNRLHINIDVARTTSTFKGSTESLDRIWPGPRTVTFNNEIPAFTVTGINFLDPTAQTFQGLFEENQRSAGPAQHVPPRQHQRFQSGPQTEPRMMKIGRPSPIPGFRIAASLPHSLRTPTRRSPLPSQATGCSP